MRHLQVRTKPQRHEYEIGIGRDVLSETGARTRACLGEQARQIALISNLKVFSLYGATVMQSLKAGGFSVWPMLIGDGERHKSLRTAETIVNFLNEAGLERSDGVVALGGGVVGDAAGFAAAVYLRGVPLIQIPTTLLAQIDSSVGGKTGVNLPLGKNLVGSFHQPSAVIIDIGTLATLPRRELTAGWCECVKQGAVASRKLFKATTDCLSTINTHGELLATGLEQLIASHCAFKASIVAADEREDTGRRDRRSRRILNFGHTIGHALEAVTNYRRFRHGEAVGHGMLVAAELSKNLGLLDQSELELFREAVRSCGPLPSVADIGRRELRRAITMDKKRTAGQVQWVLLEGIGKPRIVDGKEISPALLRKSVREVFRG
ncbi:MAG TPA: 3-dehydroquinate synthase [Pyrinomonadaceae bacterium]|nr:3-dehydroquinate synthase [Pyrinomonadaceae bacterium]